MKTKLRNIKNTTPRNTRNKLLKTGDKEKDLNNQPEKKRNNQYRGTNITITVYYLLEKMQAKR